MDDMKSKMQTERIVLNIPVELTLEEFGKLCKIGPESSAYEALEEALPLVKQYGAPKAVLRWANVDRVEGDETTIEGVTFHSRVVADKLRELPRVFLSVITAGKGLEQSGEFEDDPFLDMYNAALIYYASKYTVRYMKERFGFDGSSTLDPGSLPDWPIKNNFPLFEMIGNVEEIGATLNEKGYIDPWNSGSHIHFSGNGYQNCTLCKNYDCVGRRAPFDRAEYVRIFGAEP
jgi:hypothetical protein